MTIPDSLVTVAAIPICDDRIGDEEPCGYHRHQATLVLAAAFAALPDDEELTTVIMDQSLSWEFRAGIRFALVALAQRGES